MSGKPRAPRKTTPDERVRSLVERRLALGLSCRRMSEYIGYAEDSLRSIEIGKCRYDYSNILVLYDEALKKLEGLRKKE